MKLAIPQLPVVARELTELAQRKSTYRLRCIGVGIPLFVAIVFLIITQARADSALDLIGSGAELHTALYITLMCVLYLLAPALSCSAITTEKEKQTLSLLLISKLSPLSLVLEKICSRMIPLLSLVIGSAPLFGVAFLMGGVTVVDTVGSIGCLIFVTLQVTTVAICASALMKSGIGAFWVTYFTLLTMYFGPSLLAEVGVLSYPGPASMREGWLFLFPPYQSDMLCEEWAFGATLNTRFDLFWITVPSLLLMAAFVVIAWKAVLWMGDTGGLTFKGLLSRVSPTRWIKQIVDTVSHQAVNHQTVDSKAVASVMFSEAQIGEGQTPDDAATSVADWKENYIWSNFEAAYRPIYWRERLAMPLLRKRILLGVLSVTGLLFFSVWVNSQQQNQTDEVAAFVLSGLGLALLVMVSLATRIFARERDQQTLESLLVLPMSNQEILSEKSAVLNRAVWYLVSPIMLVTCMGIVLTETPIHKDGNVVFFLCMVGHSILYLHLVKWISLYFGLRMKTNMKAMVASLGTIVILCTVILAITVTGLISSGGSLEEGLWWFYSSPIIVPMLGAFRDLSELYERNSMPDSGLLVITLNLGIYFIVMQTVKTWTVRSLPQLLGRLDPTD